MAGSIQSNLPAGGPNVHSSPPSSPAIPRPASTVLLLRAGDRGGVEVLMVQRSLTASFMPGAYVFPGGGVDSGDASASLLARCRGMGAEEAAARLGGAMEPRAALAHLVAGARETFEEAGILLAEDGEGRAVQPSLEVTAGMRASLRAGVRGGGDDLAGWLARQGLFLSLNRLEMLSRWVTPEIESRRFDTVFLLAGVDGSLVARHDEGETTDSLWISPTEAVARYREGSLVLPPPTLRNLEDIAGFSSPEKVMDFARNRPRRVVKPRFAEVDGAWALLLPGDLLNPSDEPVEGATRIVLHEGRWWSR